MEDKLKQELEALLNKVNEINQAGFEKAGYILVDEDVMKDMKYTPQHKTTYNKDEVEVTPLGSPLNEPFYMNIEYNNKSAVEFIIEKYEKFINSENGSGEAYFYEQLVEDIKQAKAMEKEQMKEMYLKGIENYDPTFKKKSTWTSTKEGKAFMKS